MSLPDSAQYWQDVRTSRRHWKQKKLHAPAHGESLAVTAGQDGRFVTVTTCCGLTISIERCRRKSSKVTCVSCMEADHE